MDAISPLIIAGLTGFISGFLLSIPVGPINLTIINEGARRGLMWALMIGMGAVAMEVLYCFLAFTGFAAFFQAGWIKVAMELGTFIFLTYLGLKFLLVSSIPTEKKMERKIEEKLHPHSAFMIGFVRVMGNLGVFLFWIFLATQFHSHGLVQSTWLSRLSCVGGVALGTSLFFFSLSYLVSFGHKKFTEKTLIRMEQFSGVCLLIWAGIQGVFMIYKWAH